MLFIVKLFVDEFVCILSLLREVNKQIQFILKSIKK